MKFYLITVAFLFTLSARAEWNQDFINYVKIYQQSSASNPETLLKELKSSSPDYFSSYLLGYRSRSLQNSSPLSPRVILFSEKADLAVAFNGNPEHRGFKNLENMAFNYDTDRFEFYESHFEEGQKPSLSQANPRKCLECHQSASRSDIDPRPNWEPYNKWPGFYGSQDDTVDSFTIKEEYLTVKFPDPEDRMLIDEVLAEKNNFDQFELIRKAQPIINERYSLLEPILNSTYKLDPFVNAPFTKRLSILNFRRIARLMTQDKELYEFTKWSIASAKRCSTLHLTPEVALFLKENSSAPFSRRFDPKSSLFLFSDMIAMLFSPFGVDTEDWSMDFKSNGRFAFEERFGTPNNSWIEFEQGYKKYFMLDPDLTEANCQELSKQAQLRLGNITAVKEFFEKRKKSTQQSQKNLKPLLQRCISCHVENAGVVPYIPFDDRNLLKTSLTKMGYKRGTLLDEIHYRLGSHAPVTDQMPPAGVPTAKQKTELLNYLNQL